MFRSIDGSEYHIPPPISERDERDELDFSVDLTLELPTVEPMPGQSRPKNDATKLSTQQKQHKSVEQKENEKPHLSTNLCIDLQS